MTAIGTEAFYDCRTLTSVTICEGVTSIGEHAFIHCIGMTSAAIPASVTSIAQNAFSLCESMLSIEVAQENAQYSSIGGALFDKEGTTLITCPPGLTAYEFPSGVTAIGPKAFDYCSNLTDVVIPGSVVSIGELAFSNCTALRSAALLDGVTSIGNRAFFECFALESLTIPASVTEIGNMICEFCECLAEIQFNGTCAQWEGLMEGTDNYMIAHYMRVVCVDGIIGGSE